GSPSSLGEEAPLRRRGGSRLVCFNGVAEFTRRRDPLESREVRSALPLQWGRRVHSAKRSESTRTTATDRSSFNGVAEFTRRRARAIATSPVSMARFNGVAEFT